MAGSWHCCVYHLYLDVQRGFRSYQRFLRNLGLIQRNIPWLASKDMAFLTVIIATVWKGYPFFTLMLLAGLQAISPEYYESARIDGAGAISQFRYITLPAMRQVIAIIVMQNGLWVFRNYDLVAVMTGGGPNRATETIPQMLYNEAFQYFRLGSGSAVGVLGLITCLILISFLLHRNGGNTF